MVYLNCDLCGKPALPSERSVLMCCTCQAKFEEFCCRECGARVGYAVDARKPASFLAGLCSLCHMRKRLADVPESDRAAIRLAAADGTFAGIVQARQRLGWSIHDATDAVRALMGDA